MVSHEIDEFKKYKSECSVEVVRCFIRVGDTERAKGSYNNDGREKNDIKEEITS